MFLMSSRYSEKHGKIKVTTKTIMEAFKSFI